MSRTIINGYKKVELHPVTQSDKTFFIGIIPASDFINSYTVEPTEYDIEKEKSVRATFPELSEYVDNVVRERQKNLNVNNWLFRLGFQRRFDKKRVKEISEFLLKDEYPFFPNSIIATCDLINTVLGIDGDFNEVCDQYQNEEGNLSFLENKEGKFNLYYPLNRKAILVIDGQHRLEGLKKAYCDKPDRMNPVKYDLIVSFILDFDRSVIARLFYTINYTQKSVNKSLLYHLTSEFSKELNEIVFLHELVKSLNEKKGSPLENRIKMLGRTPDASEIDALNIQRHMMTISQASIIDYLMPCVAQKREKALIQPIFLYYFKNEKISRAHDFVYNYFSAIRCLLPEWDDPRTSIASKTASVGAFISLMNLVFIKIAVDNGISKIMKSDQCIPTEEISKNIEGIRSVDFREFAGESSLGTLNKIKNRLISSVFSVNEDALESFLNAFRSNYSKKFAEWLAENA